MRPPNFSCHETIISRKYTNLLLLSIVVTIIMRAGHVTPQQAPIDTPTQTILHNDVNLSFNFHFCEIEYVNACQSCLETCQSCLKSK